MKIRDSHYGTSSIFRTQDGPQTYSSYKTGEGTPRRSQDHPKNHFFKDFDEFHNFGLELQTKAKGKIITNNVSLIHLYNTCYITLTQFSS